MKETHKNTAADCCKGCLKGIPGQNAACRTKMRLTNEDLIAKSSTKIEQHEN